MRRSSDRILTTHAGSLPRPPAILELVEGRDQRAVLATPGAASLIEQAVRAVVQRQVAAGIDVPSDGEMGRVGFAAYATERLSGFDGELRPMQPQVERTLFPEFYADTVVTATRLLFPACSGPIRWRGPAFIQRDIATFKAAMAPEEADAARAALGAEATLVAADASGAADAAEAAYGAEAAYAAEVAAAAGATRVAARSSEAFMPAVSPGQIWLNFSNDFYPSDEAFVFAAAEALANEYRAIVDAGFILQLDDPGLAMGWNRLEFANRTLDDYRRIVAQHVEAINLALVGIPAERVRLHVCWGNGEWPHVRDVPLAEIIDLLYTVNAQGLSVEGANPRHGHEWRVFEDHPLPAGKVLVPGVIDTLTNFVEHPDLVAERIARYASVVGPTNVIAGTDCGFSTTARSQPRVHPTVAWAKLETLAEGARRASHDLFP